MSDRLKSIYCPNCGRFLGKEDLREGTIETKCHGCKKWLQITATQDRQEKIIITDSEINKIKRK